MGRVNLRTAFLYPGQGAQYVGMGQDFYDAYPVAKAVFAQADAVLQKNLTKTVFEGPQEVLSQTENTQSAMLTVCTAITQLLEEHGVSASHAAGLSLGEYAALVAAGTLPFSEAVQLVEDRARFMQEAVPQGIGGMTAVLGLSADDVQAAVRKGQNAGEVYVANYNAPGQIVITGTKEGLQAAGEEAENRGAQRLIPLDVSAPFHSPLLDPAKKRLAERLQTVVFSPLTKRVYANVDARPIASEQDIPALLARQVTGSIYFQQSIQAMLEEGVSRFIEIGPGKTLTGFVKRIAREQGAAPKLVNIRTVDDFTAFIRQEKEMKA
ncbi:MAG: ACP S-malonyltransferase [Tissierellia bacterium]|jgi:[acyl-carrier-protein] S-malonyltransferase|nr:ACP S-malonyltransferase [Bacillota bacterium]NLK58661.1 ACP S-malonyltransferase [Tissierellia bacterium]